ncbi:MAG: hypothetical protein AAGA61_04960 [Pseudomonadota bacterium]
MRLAAYRPYQAFKFTVYALLTTNVVLFFLRESAAIGFRFGAGLGPGELIEGFAATIDTAAWLLLLLMFELETWTLDDRHLTVRVSVALRGLRAASYVVIVYAFYGYLSRLQFFLGATPVMGVSDLCALADGSWAYALGPDNYAVLTAANCAGFPHDSGLMQLRDVSTVVDTAGLAAIVRLAVVDLINSGVWLLVVGVQDRVKHGLRGRRQDECRVLQTAPCRQPDIQLQ